MGVERNDDGTVNAQKAICKFSLLNPSGNTDGTQAVNLSAFELFL